MKETKFTTRNPRNGGELPGDFPVTPSQEISLLVRRATDAHFELLSMPGSRIGGFVHAVAKSLERVKDEVLRRCEAETALPISPRLMAEWNRMLNGLRSFGELAISGAAADAKFAPALPDRLPAPRPDLRTRRVGIGPVAVLESSNFPLAFGVAGGDTASAWAAGCPVIAKAHPLHAGTSQLISDAIAVAVEACGMPGGTFSVVQGDADVARELLMEEGLRGVAFTGSRRAGMSILKLVNSRGRPLDAVSLEMGSVNPLFVLPGAVKERGSEIAKGLSSAVLLGAGQFCTKPGLVFVANDDLEGVKLFIETVKAEMDQAPRQVLLSPEMASLFEAGCEALSCLDGVTALTAFRENDTELSIQPTVLTVSFDTFMSNDQLIEEVFGPFMLIVTCHSTEMALAAHRFQGELTGTMHVGRSDEFDTVKELMSILERKVGRVVFNSFPPGVEVCEAMNHSGPWPAGLGNVSVVGPTSINRWLRPICYQNVPEKFLPSEVKST